MGKTMKIKSVKLFQAVRIDGQTEMSIQPEAPIGAAPNVSGFTVELVENGIYIRRRKACTFTTWSNVQYVEYFDSEAEVVPLKKAK